MTGIPVIIEHWGMADLLSTIRELEHLSSDFPGEAAGAGRPEKTAVSRSPVVKLVNSIIACAVEENASDIHIEPAENGMRIRYRIDGLLREIVNLPEKAKQPLISRLKILSNMDIAEKRKPQDGRFHVKYRNVTVDLRVSTMPNIFGEKAVIRLLDKSSRFMEINQLGFSKKNHEAFMNILKHSHGMLLLTGPTGCGKTTTLYAALNEMNSLDKNIVTIEDPVEYILEGVSQTQVHPKAGLTFAVGLRSILRQDPDVIMVGEIRDAETAEIAMRAASTGHLVLTTLHTNDAAGALTRLIDMGVEPFLVASSVLGVVAQRLVRVICPHCKEPCEPPGGAEERAFLSAAGGATAILYRGKGCTYCGHTGYRGRTGIHEIVTVTKKIRELIHGKRSSDEIKEQAVREGAITLKRDGLEKVLKGLTTVEEVMRVAYGE
ncbi:MAG TPA: GspE/PulE family protein [Bacillota bacterium]|nr:GspE/PulE family protein [Bacillota bacterium]